MVAGFYEPYTHNVVPVEDCPVEDRVVRDVVNHLLEQVRKRKYRVYNERDRKGNRASSGCKGSTSVQAKPWQF